MYEDSTRTVEPYMNMAAANIPPEKPELLGYYLQIPEKAEVKRVPISMLSSSVQQRISRLHGRTKTDVIVVSPIIMQNLPKSHKANVTAATQAAAGHSHPELENQPSDGRPSTGKANGWTGTDRGINLVPVKCCKDTALTILQLSQASNEETRSLEGQLQTLSDSLLLDLQVMNMRASALCMYNNMMYLLPESRNTPRSEEEEREAKEKVQDSETSGFLCGAEKTEREIVPSKIKQRSTNRERRDSGRDCALLHAFPFLQQQSGRLEVGATCVKLWDEDQWNLPAEVSSNSAGPSPSPRTENDLQSSPEQNKQANGEQYTGLDEEQLLHAPFHFRAHSGRTFSAKIYFLENSEKQMKRKPTSVDDRETFLKRLHLGGSDTKHGSLVAKDGGLTCSPPHPHSPPGAPSPPTPQESSSLWSPANSPRTGNTADLEGLSSPSSSPRCSTPAHSAPAPPGPTTTCGNGSPPCFHVQSSPSLSDFTSSEHSNEPKEMASSSEPSTFNHVRSDLLDVDDTTRDERTQRLLERVREFDKKVEDIRQKKKPS